MSRRTTAVAAIFCAILLASCSDKPVATPDSDAAPAAYHLLLSSWGVAELEGAAQFLYGWRAADVPAAGLDESSLVLANDCSLRVTTTAPAMPNAVESGCVDETSVAHELLVDGVSLDFPEVSGDQAVIAPWTLNLSHMTPPSTDDRPTALSGMGTVTSDLASGAGQRAELVQAFAMRKSRGARIADLVGDWGFIRLENITYPTGPIHNLSTVLSFPITISSADGGTLQTAEDAEQIEAEFLQMFDGSTVQKRRFNRTSYSFSFDLRVAQDGAVRLLGTHACVTCAEQTVSGFMSPSADLILLAEGVPSITHVRDGSFPAGTDPDFIGEDNFVSHQLIALVRRDTNPQLAGRSYRPEGIRHWVTTAGFELRAWDSGATLTFGEEGTGEWAWNESTRSVKFDGTPGVAEASSQTTVNFTYTVESDGRIFLDIDHPDVEQTIIAGYSQPDGGAMVFAHGVSYSEATQGEIGMWIAYPIDP